MPLSPNLPVQAASEGDGFEVSRNSIGLPEVQGHHLVSVSGTVDVQEMSGIHDPLTPISLREICYLQGCLALVAGEKRGTLRGEGGDGMATAEMRKY